MSAADAVQDGSLVTQEKAKLRRVLGRIDLVLFTACAIVGLDSVAQAAEAGAQAITWLVISLVLSLVAMVLLGLLFWQIGERKRRAGLVGIELPPELLAQSGQQGLSR